MSDCLQPHGLQEARLPCPSPTPRVCSNSCPSSDAIQPSHPLLFPSPPAFNLSQHQGLFQSQFFASGGQICLLHQVVNMLITILLIFSLYLSFFHATYFFFTENNKIICILSHFLPT